MGFKAYSLGRDEWKVAKEEKEFKKEKSKNDLISKLQQLEKQARTRAIRV